MKHLLICFLFLTITGMSYCQLRMQQFNNFRTSEYIVDIFFYKVSTDSSLVEVTFKNIGTKPVYILDTFTVKHDFEKANLDVYFGEEFINSTDSSQVMRQIMPDKDGKFRKRIYFSGSTWVRLLCGYVCPEMQTPKTVFIRKDFPRWQDYRQFNYVFLITCN